MSRRTGEHALKDISGQHPELSSMSEQISSRVAQYLDACTNCRRCMDVCPIFKNNFSIELLNQATQQGAHAPAVIKEFAWDCIQCERCVPVCPVGVHRDTMVQFLRFKLGRERPWGFKRYVLIRGPNLRLFPGMLQHLYVVFKRIAHRDLARFMEVRPMKEAEVLFYPGCYLYSDRTVRQTVRLLDHLGCSYTILGGMSTCCGMPHLLQGDFNRAEECMRQLHRDIKAVHPKIILTGCAECQEALVQIKETYKEKFEVLSVVEYLVRHQERFPQVRIKGNIRVHESCRFSQSSLAARKAASRFGNLVSSSDQIEVCCSHWNHRRDPVTIKQRFEYLQRMKTTGDTLACTCLTCYEEFKNQAGDFDVIDVIQLFDDALQVQPSKET
jgi:Fe-S oxidoreductase